MDRERLIRGVELFNRAEFFDAHEELEQVWRDSAGPEKKFLQALIQSAVALHHHSHGNLAGARSLMLRSFNTLRGYPDVFAAIHVEGLRKDLAVWKLALEAGGPYPPLPRLEFRDLGEI